MGSHSVSCTGWSSVEKPRPLINSGRVMASMASTSHLLLCHRPQSLLRFSIIQTRAITSSTQTKTSDRHVTVSPTAKLRRSFQLLDLVQDECSEEEIRKAYIGLAKKYHPDSRSSLANADRFTEVLY